MPDDPVVPKSGVPNQRTPKGCIPISEAPFMNTLNLSRFGTLLRAWVYSEKVT